MNITEYVLVKTRIGSIRFKLNKYRYCGVNYGPAPVLNIFVIYIQIFFKLSMM